MSLCGVAELTGVGFLRKLVLEVEMGKGTIGSKEMDAYISAQSSETRRAIGDLRSCILQAAPNASELMNYGIPAFALVEGGKRDQQIMIAGFPKHAGFYPGPDVIEAFANQLSGYKFAKGPIQFPLNEAIPAALVIKMVRYKLSRLRK